MRRANLKLAAILFTFVLSSLGVWSQAEAVGRLAACCDFADRCSTMTNEEILTAARSGQFGTCYYHERCPTCVCPFYVKVSYYNDQKGYDGGTGCLFDLNTVASTLRRLCEDGVCCCPNLVPNPCGDQTPVQARDSATGACCTLPNRCTVPSGWTIGGCSL